MDFNTVSMITVVLGFIVTRFYLEATQCTELAILHREYRLTSYIEDKDYKGIVWVRPSDGQYVVTCNPLTTCSPTSGYSAYANESHGILTVANVKIKDIGNWTIIGTNKSALVTPVCVMAASLPPTCTITTDEDTEDLETEVEISLMVNVTGYYCTREHSLNLTTGDVTEELMTGESGTELLNHTSSVTFNVTQSHFGNVTVNFVCEDTQWDIYCAGVTKLVERIPTTQPPTTELTTQLTTPSTTTSTALSSVTSPAQSTPTGASTGNPPGTGSTDKAPELEDGINIPMIAGIVGGCLGLILVVAVLIASRDKLKKTYKYIVNRGERKYVKEEEQNEEKRTDSNNL